MGSYSIVFEESQKYSAFIYSTSYVNPIHYIEEISTDLKTNKSDVGYVLFDLILSNGNGFNRFAEAFFDGNYIIKDTVNVVELSDPEIIEKADAHYKGRTEELENSVLSIFQRMRYEL